MVAPLHLRAGAGRQEAQGAAVPHTLHPGGIHHVRAQLQLRLQVTHTEVPNTILCLDIFEEFHPMSMGRVGARTGFMQSSWSTRTCCRREGGIPVMNLTVTGVLVSAERSTWSASWPASSAAWAATWGSSSGCQSWTLSSLASGSSDSFSELQGSKLEFLEIGDLCNTIKAVYIENLSFPGICLLYLSILWVHSSSSPQQPRAAWPILHKHNIKLCTT